MSKGTNVDINFVTSLNNTGTKKMESEITKLSGSLKKLGATFAGTFAANKILAFGTASVKAFAEDDKSAKILAKTLGNLGQSFADVGVENFISKLSELNGIAKTDLRSSFDTLMQATGDATKSQNLLNLALGISAGTSRPLANVSMALGKAYDGNTASLTRLGVGLTKQQLKMMDFNQITTLLTDKFKGQASTAADTFAGKINRLGVAFEDFKISVGQGITDALTSLGNGIDPITQIQDAMKKLSGYVSALFINLIKVGAWMSNNLTLIKSVAIVMAQIWVAGKILTLVTAIQTVIGAMKALKIASLEAAAAEALATGGANLAAGIFALTVLGIGEAYVIAGDQAETASQKFALSLPKGSDTSYYGRNRQDLYPKPKAPVATTIPIDASSFAYNGNLIAQSKIQADIAKRIANDKATTLRLLKEQNALSKQAVDLALKEAKAKADQLASERASKLLKLAGQVTDLNNIEIQAALQRGQTQQVTDVLLLQRAEITNNAEEANILAKKILEANGLVMDVSGNITTLKNTLASGKTPFADWPKDSSDAISAVKALETEYHNLYLSILAANNEAAKVAKGNQGGIPLVDPTKVIPPTPDGSAYPPILPGIAPRTPQSAILSGSSGSSSVNPMDTFSLSGTLPFNAPGVSQTPLGNNYGGISVVVMLDGQAVSGAIQDSLVNSSASGNPANFARSGYFGT